MNPRLVDEAMSDVDALIWAVEREPRLRTTIAALARVAGQIETSMLRHRVERASRLIPRLRQRVVADPLGLAAPRWSSDPEFRLSFHLRRIRLGDATEAQLLAVVRDLIAQPFDRSRPLWEFTVIDGLPKGESALLLKSHHCVSDGLGGAEMMLELFDLDAAPDPDRQHLPPVPVADHSRGQASVSDESPAATTAPPSMEEITEQAHRLGASIGSALRLFRPLRGGALPSPRSAGLELRSLSLPLADLQSAGARVGGTINDAFVAAVAIGTTDHHRDARRDGSLRVSIPISTRTTADGAGGNHWTPGRIELNVGEAAEPDRVIAQVRRKIRGLRSEPGHRLIAPLAAGIRRLPDVVAAPLFASMSSGLDIAASNVAGSPTPLHLCGQEVHSLIPFGPLSGCAINVTLMSHGGIAQIGVATDPAAVPDADGQLREFEAAFTSVVKGS